jgi:hypothetical protein
MLYRILPTDSRAMPLDCTSEEFATEYLACRQNPDRPTDHLYSLIMPFFSHWERMLREPEYPKDINYLALCRRLYPQEEPFELLEYFINWADQTSSLREELELLFFERLRNLKYYPKLAAPRMAEYVIAMDFRNYLKDKIVSSARHPIDVPCSEITFDGLEVEDAHPDHLLLKNLGLDAWESYLLHLLTLGMNTMEISALTRLPRKTFANEENEIWHRLRQKWHQA